MASRVLGRGGDCVPTEGRFAIFSCMEAEGLVTRASNIGSRLAEGVFWLVIGSGWTVDLFSSPPRHGTNLIYGI